MDENMALTPYDTREILFYKTDNGDVKVEIPAISGESMADAGKDGGAV